LSIAGVTNLPLYTIVYTKRMEKTRLEDEEDHCSSLIGGEVRNLDSRM
jgi:hypothetical protein